MESIKINNNLNSEIIRKGEELIIPLRTQTVVPYNEKEAKIKFYKVQNNDTLSGLSVKFDIEKERIIQLNNLKGTFLRSGQTLRLPSETSIGDYYIIQSGDTLSAISLLFDISQEQIRQINNLTGNNLQTGGKLLVSPVKPQTYTVEKGDSIWNIASTYNLSLDELKQFNKMESDRIFPGQEIQLYPYTVENGNSVIETPPKNILLASYQEKKPEEYINYKSDNKIQPNASYAETRLDDPMLNYKQARSIMDQLDRSINNERRISNDLAGYHIVLDPGHGGLDPGAVVPSKNGNGDTVYVVEDEYAYDITLRTYRLLKLNGADVELTIISPNHHIRSSENPSETFVNMKNEVYNNSDMNKNRNNSCWPIGGSRGLRKRVDIAEDFFKGKPRKNCLYISIHADNSPDHGQGTIVLYNDEESGSQKKSIELAEDLVPFLGASSSTDSQSLAVLRDNPAWAEVLIEIRNLHFPGNSWAIRYDKLRQQDAEFITAGLINYASNR